MDGPSHPTSSDGGPGGRAAGESEAAQDAGSSGPSSDDRTGLYRLLVDSVQDYAIFILDPEGNVLSWNAGAERLKGYRPEEIIGRHFSTFYPPEDIAAGKPARELVDARADGRVEDEGWRLRKDGTRFWANVVITALRDAGGTMVGFAKVTRDLTERKRAEQALRDSEERFRMLVHSVKDYAIFMLDPKGNIASWNEGAERIKGYKAHEIIGRHFSTFYPPEDLAAGKPPMELEVAIRTGKYEEEGWRVRKDGSMFWANVLITAVWGADGSLLGFTKVTRDLTERRAAQERALADARRIATVEATNRTRSAFLAAMSHELRTPINATLGYAELMEMGIGGPVTVQQQEYLTRIRRTQEHLLHIISDLLNYNRIEAGRVQYHLAPVPLYAVIQTVLQMLEPQALAKEIAIEIGPCPPSCMVAADRLKAEQILLNLTSNAVKFTPNGGRIVVICEEAGEMIATTIADSGPGIPVDEQESIFEPFVQLGRSLTSGHEGTGLGLSISRDLARAMGGDVTVQSALGSGAKFTVLLPKA